MWIWIQRLNDPIIISVKWHKWKLTATNSNASTISWAPIAQPESHWIDLSCSSSRLVTARQCSHWLTWAPPSRQGCPNTTIASVMTFSYSPCSACTCTASLATASAHSLSLPRLKASPITTSGSASEAMPLSEDSSSRRLWTRVPAALWFALSLKSSKLASNRSCRAANLCCGPAKQKKIQVTSHYSNERHLMLNEQVVSTKWQPTLSAH